MSHFLIMSSAKLNLCQLTLMLKMPNLIPAKINALTVSVTATYIGYNYGSVCLFKEQKKIWSVLFNKLR